MEQIRKIIIRAKRLHYAIMLFFCLMKSAHADLAFIDYEISRPDGYKVPAVAKFKYNPKDWDNDLLKKKILGNLVQKHMLTDQNAFHYGSVIKIHTITIIDRPQEIRLIVQENRNYYMKSLRKDKSRLSSHRQGTIHGILVLGKNLGEIDEITIKSKEIDLFWKYLSNRFPHNRVRTLRKNHWEDIKIAQWKSSGLLRRRGFGGDWLTYIGKDFFREQDYDRKRFTSWDSILPPTNSLKEYDTKHYELSQLFVDGKHWSKFKNLKPSAPKPKLVENEKPTKRKLFLVSDSTSKRAKVFQKRLAEESKKRQQEKTEKYKLLMAKAKQKSAELREKTKQRVYKDSDAFKKLKVWPDSLHWKGEKAYMGDKRVSKFDRKFIGFKSLQEF